MTQKLATTSGPAARQDLLKRKSDQTPFSVEESPGGGFDLYGPPLGYTPKRNSSDYSRQAVDFLREHEELFAGLPEGTEIRTREDAIFAGEAHAVVPMDAVYNDFPMEGTVVVYLDRSKEKSEDRKLVHVSVPECSEVRDCSGTVKADAFESAGREEVSRLTKQRDVTTLPPPQPATFSVGNRVCETGWNYQYRVIRPLAERKVDRQDWTVGFGSCSKRMLRPPRNLTQKD